MKTVLCVSRNCGYEWKAICLDFDLAVQGLTFDVAQALLTNAIANYIDHALKQDEPTRSRLLNRRTPFLRRICWRFACTILEKRIVRVPVPQIDAT